MNLSQRKVVWVFASVLFRLMHGGEVVVWWLLYSLSVHHAAAVAAIHVQLKQ